MPQDEYIINTDPSGALLQDIRELIYTNLDLSYIPQYGHIYELVNEELVQQSEYLLPYRGPAGFGSQRFLTYASIELTTGDITDALLVANGDYISYWNNISLSNIYRFKDIITYNRTLGIAYNPNNKLLYAVRNKDLPGTSTTSSIIVAVDLIAQTETLVNITGLAFSYLTGINFDVSYNNLYVADYTGNNVSKIVFSNNYTGSGTIIVNSFAGINGPYSVTNDAENNIYVSNSISNSVVKVSNTGAFSIFGTGLGVPAQIQYNFTDNKLYVAGYGNSSVFPEIKAFIRSISNGIVTNIYSAPPSLGFGENFFGLAIDPSGNIYYTSAFGTGLSDDFFMGKLTQDNNGFGIAGLWTYDSTYLPPVSFSIRPITSVAVNYSKNTIYAAGYTAPWPNAYNPGNPTPYSSGIIWDISLNDPTYTPRIFYPTNYESSSINQDPSMNNPTSVAFDADYNLYVGNSVDSNILVIDPDANGTFLDVSGVVLNGPTGLVFDSLYNLYAANYLSDTICKLTFPVNPFEATGTTLPITGAIINEPTSLAIDNVNNILYIANTGFNNILSVNLTTYVATIYATIPTGTKNPPGLVYDSDRGLLYVTNQNTNQIGVIANQQGPADVKVVYNTGVQLLSPQGIAIDTSNNILYVANYGSSLNPVVEITLDISSNIIYNSQLDGLPLAYDLAMSFADDPSGSGMVFIAGENVKYIPVVTSGGIINQYALFPSPPGFGGFYRMTSCDIIDIYGPSSSFLSPYYLYVGSYPGDDILYLFVALPSNLNVPFQLSTAVTLAPMSITGDVPNFVTPTGFPPNQKYTGYSIVFGKSPATGPYDLYVSDEKDQVITKLVINAPNYFDAVGTYLNINFSGNNFYPGRMAIYNSMMYCLDASANLGVIRVCKIDLTNPQYALDIIASIPAPTTGGVGITCDALGYVYIAGNSIYRLTPDPDYDIGIVVSTPDVTSSQLASCKNMVYDKFDNSIYCICSRGDYFGNIVIESALEKIYLSFKFNFNNNIHIDEYTDTLYIADIVSSTGPPLVDFSFNVYQNYIIIDPSNIPQNTPTNISIYFINPSVIPNPTDTYYLECGTTKISNPFCNNCTYNDTKFLAGTYPTGLVYSDFSKYLYVALQNNTISRINSTGLVQNNYIPESIGLKGPTSILLDISFNLYVLNVTGGFITKLTLTNEIITANNSFYTNIDTPICLTYDYVTNKYLYLLSGKVPSMIITRIDISNPANFLYLPIPFGSLYDSNGLVVGAPTIFEEYLYVSNTDQFGVNSIRKITLMDQVDLSNNVYNIQTEIVLNSNKQYKPYTLDYISEYLYVSNKNTPSSITKIRVANQALGIPASAIQPWAVNGISVPVGLAHDPSGNLYVANAGTGPRNSRISKINIDYFPFRNVVLANGTCANARIYDVTTKSYINVNYDIANPTRFPIPYPFPIQG